VSSLAAFTDFLVLTRQKQMSDPSKVINQATKYRTNLISAMMKGLTMKEMFQGGTEIVDFIQLKMTSSFAYYNPTDTATYVADNSATMLKVPWRFWKVDSVTHATEIALNQGTPAEIFKKVKRFKDSRMDTNFWEGMEDGLWATPEVATMEGTLGIGLVGKPLSLRCFITDDGLAPSSTNGGVTGANWTTVMTVDPVLFPNWKNQFATYDNTSLATREASFILAMDRIWNLCQFMAPGTTQEFVQDTNLNKMRIVSNLETRLLLVKLATARNNVLTPKNDLGWANGNVVYHGLPTDYIAALDNVDTGADTGTTAKYKARFLNFKHIKPWFHSEWFRKTTKLDGGASNPLMTVVREDTWGNYWLANRREQGVVRAA
jgi:hypothetical protein